MLFLAVFWGFLAEYQLEHKIEKDREKQFINSLVADLQDDEKILLDMTSSEQLGIASLDTLMDLLNNPSLAKQNGDQLYYVARIYSFCQQQQDFWPAEIFRWISSYPFPGGL